MSKEIYGLDIGAVYMVLTRGLKKNNDFIGDVLRTSTDVFENIKFLFGQTAQKSCIRDFKTTIQLVKDLLNCSVKIDIKKPKLYNYCRPDYNGIDKEYFSVYHNKLLTYTPEDFYSSLMYEAKTIMKERHPNPDELRYENNTYVLSYPPYYTAEQKNALKTIAQRSFHREMENKNDRKFDDKEKLPDYNEDVYVIPEYVAAALTYGYENNSSFSEKKNIVIIDIGYYCSYCVSCVYERGKCTINSKKHSFEISGSIIDERIFQYFKEKIEKLDEKEDKLKPKEELKLRIEISKIKEKLSASGADTVQINVDGILDDDEDYSDEFSVEELNKIIKDLPDKLIGLLKDTVGKYVDLTNYDVVIIGGSLRIPLFQTKLEEAIHHQLIRTLNMDESVAYGCIYYGAMKKGIWSYEINIIDEEKIENELALLSGKWKGIRHKIEEVYSQESESNEAAKNRNSIERMIYDLQHKIVDSNKDYEGFCNKLLRILKLRGFVYLPSKMLKLYEDEIDKVNKAYDKTIIRPSEERQKNDLRGLLHLDEDDSKSKSLEELISDIQNKNEGDVNTVNNVLKDKPPSKYEIGKIKSYNYKHVGENVVIIVGKEYDIKNGKWTYEIETVDGVMTYKGVDEKELEEISIPNSTKKSAKKYYIGQKLDKEREVIDVFETGYITTRRKKRYFDYLPLE